MALNNSRRSILLLLALAVVIIKSFFKNVSSLAAQHSSYNFMYLKPKAAAAALAPNRHEISPRALPSTSPSVSPITTTKTSAIGTSSSLTEKPSQHPTEESTTSSSVLTEDSNSRRSCMNRVFYDKLPALIAKLNSDHNGLALQPLDLEYTINGAEIVEHVDGFNLTALHGRRMLLLGDSTLFYPHKFLYQLMVQQHDRWQNFTTSNLKHAITLDDANKLLWEQEPWMNFSNNIKNAARYAPPKPIRFLDNNDTLIEWVGMSGLRKNDSEERLRDMHTGIRRIKPHIIVANMGLHWLQICAFSMQQCPTNVATVERFVYYEAQWLQTIVRTAQEVNASLVLFKTTNYVNVSSRAGQWGPRAWAKWDRRLQRFRPRDILACVKYVYELIANDSSSSIVHMEEEASSSSSTRRSNLTDAQIKEYCMYSQYTEVGSKYLNHRLHAFVEDYNNNTRQPSLAVGIFNDHDLEINSLTTDGIHHPFIALLRLRLLVNTIQSYDECIHIPKNTASNY